MELCEKVSGRTIRNGHLHLRFGCFEVLNEFIEGELQIGGCSNFDLNSAHEEDLAEIPGIGPDLARAIINARPFETMEEVAKVPGIIQDNIDELLRAGATVGNPQVAANTESS